VFHSTCHTESVLLASIILGDEKREFFSLREVYIFFCGTGV
jgi:hypothetical protein